jgi:hypothetical protein
MTDHIKTCAFCGDTFHTRYPKKLTCSFECGKRYDAMRQRERHQARKRAAPKKDETQETRGLGT